MNDYDIAITNIILIKSASFIAPPIQNSPGVLVSIINGYLTVQDYTVTANKCC